MSVLNQKLEKAANEFTMHNFAAALALYEDCLVFCNKTDEHASTINNIMTTKGTLQSILGDLSGAISTLNEVLRNDPGHWLCRMRRSQVYKKKNQLRKALKDIHQVSIYCPDNLQIVALKMEIQSLISRSKTAHSSQSQSDTDQDEVQKLNFSNLKKIDRKSCSIMIKDRKSRVTICGDTAIQYEREDDNYDKSAGGSTSISKEQAEEKFIKTFREIQIDDEETFSQGPSIVVKANPNNRSKSILKNRITLNMNTNVNNVQSKQDPVIQDRKSKYGGRESKLILKLKDIDGKIISSSHSIGSSETVGKKEVEFRKSTFASQQKQQPPPTLSVAQKKPTARKSCLKRSSFQNIVQQVKEKPAARRSKFQNLPKMSIDGPVIKNRNSIERDGEVIKQANKHNNDNDSDCSSSFNIYGSNQVVISPQVRKTLGLSQEQSRGQDKSQEQTQPQLQLKPNPKPRANGGKSILKKNSILGMGNGISTKTTTASKPTSQENIKQEQVAVVAKKAKKSVMFTKSKFAQS